MCCDSFGHIWLFDRAVSFVVNCRNTRSDASRSDPTIFIIRIAIEGGNGLHGSTGKCVRRPSANMVFIVGMESPVVVPGNGVVAEVTEEAGDDDVAVGWTITDMRVAPP